jgi:hypothetical protein
MDADKNRTNPATGDTEGTEKKQNTTMALFAAVPELSLRSL